MTLDEVLNLDISGVSRLAKDDPRELRKLTSRLNAVAAKRVKRLEKTGLNTPSLGAFKRGGGAQTIRGKSIQGVQSQFGKLRQFLSSGQSTVTQARRFQTEIRERLGITDLDEEQTRNFWDVLGQIRDKHGSVREWVPSSELIAYLRDLATGAELTPEQMLERAQSWINEQYEAAEYEELEEVGGGVSGFFDE